MSIKILQGNALDVLSTLQDESIHCVVTSPPYYGLRDYGTKPQIWDSDYVCEHEWGKEQQRVVAIADKRSRAMTERRALMDGQKASQGSWCQLCGAWRGHLGLEPTPELYIDHLVQIFREVRRVLRKDGTFWLNIGDSYSGSGKGGNPDGKQSTNKGSQTIGVLYSNNQQHNQAVTNVTRKVISEGVKSKDLIGIPWMLAFALRNDGWYLRSEIIWSKANPMPESVRDRPTSAHEKIFLFSKSERYYYDADAVAEPSTNVVKNITLGPKSFSKGQSSGANVNPTGNALSDSYVVKDNRNLRNVWHLTHEPFADAHFATYPSKIPERAIMAGSSEKGCCGKCGAPWSRSIEVSEQESDGLLGLFESKKVKTIQWKPTCNCNSNVVPCTILDPFNGAATTGLVAARLARNYIGVELNPKYVDISNKRLDNRAGLFMEFVE